MNNRRDLTTGRIETKLLAFAWPIMLMNLLQAVYNLADMIIVGQFVGSTGMSAVSVGGQVTHLVLCVCNGLSNGGSAYIGQLVGAKKNEDARKVVGTLLTFLLVLAVLFTVGVIALLHPLLRGLNVPPESYTETARYLTICMSGTIFVYMYNAVGAALRGIGESLWPMIFVIITTTENVLLDLLFVGVFHWGASGAALATILCQATSMTLVILYTKHRTDLFDFKRSSFRIHRDKLGQLMRVGLPQAIQYVCTNISFLLVSSLINSYGVVASAAAGATNKISTFVTLPGTACMSAIVTMTAQNLPGKQYKRIIRGMLTGMALSFSIAMMFFVICQVAPGSMYALFTPEEAVVAVGSTYLRIYALTFVVEVIMFCLFGVLTGSGHTEVSMLNAIFSAFAVRYVLAHVLSAYTPLGFNGIAVAYSAAPMVGILVALFFIGTGRWKKSAIRVE